MTENYYDIDNINEVSTETDITIIRELANKFNIKHVGVKKTVLVEEINLKLEEENKMTHDNNEGIVAVIGSNEVVEEVTVAPELETEVQNSDEVVSEGETLAVITPETETEAPESQTNEKPAESRQSGKWFEQEGGFPYTEGQVVKITGGYKPLIGRYASIVGPSKKKDAIKAHLFKPNKPTELQDTKVTFNFGDFEVFEGEVPVVETKRKKEAVNVVTPEETIVAEATVEVVEPQVTENEAV